MIQDVGYKKSKTCIVFLKKIGPNGLRYNELIILFI